MNKLFFYCYISSNSGLFLVFGTFLDFDTSYVKVYQEFSELRLALQVFQNISC